MRLLDVLDGVVPRPPRMSDFAARSEERSPDSMHVALSPPAVAVIRVQLHGELDLATIARSRRILTAAVDAVAAHAAQQAAGVPGRVVCDVSGVEFLAACGVRTMVEVGEYAHLRGVDVDVRGSHGVVRRVLDLAGLDGAVAVPS